MATYVFTIGGAAKILQVGWSILETANGRNRFDGVLLSRTGSYRPALDDEILLTENGTRIFGGLIDQPVESGVFGALSKPNLSHQIGAADFNVYASRIHLTADIVAGNLKAALTVIAAALSAQGVTLDGAQVNGPTLPALSYDDVPIEDALNEIMAVASGTGTTSYVWEIDYTKVLRGFETGTLSAPFNLTDGDSHMLGDFTVEQPRPSNYANYITLLGGTGTRTVTDTFTGDGVTVTFPLTYTYSAGWVVVVNGLFETLGTAPATWIYDPVANTITRTSAPGVGVAISITYVGQFPKLVTADGGVAIANRVQRTYTLPDEFDAVVLQAIANSYLTRDMTSPKTVTYACRYSQTGLHPGQIQTIGSSKHGLSGSHLVTDVRIVNVRGRLVQRQITAVSTSRLPSTLRESFQQTFGRSSGAASGGSVTVVTGGTFLSSPASLGGSDTLFRRANSFVRVPNAQPYVAPATMSVKIRGTVAAHVAVNVSVRLRDEVHSVTGASAGPTAATSTPADYLSATGSVVVGNTYWLQMQSGTADVDVTALGHVEGV